jgi:hypothetical protein
MTDSRQVPLRQRLCRGQACGAVFYVCRSCDRGQRYCSDVCRTSARRAQRRAANGRHQQSPEGKADHRDRQREYRRRLNALRVTDQGSGGMCDLPTLGGEARDEAEEEPNRLADIHAGLASCVVCGRGGVFIDPWPR